MTAPHVGSPLSSGGPAFLTTHRAASVCGREFARLGAALAAGATSRASADGLERPVVRQAPDRCIVQYGPVALTVAWLRGATDSPADGELLAIVWQGVIAPRGDHAPERLHFRPANVAPASVWEESHRPVAESEASWRWQAGSADATTRDALELASHCLARLLAAHAAVQPATGGTVPIS